MSANPRVYLKQGSVHPGALWHGDVVESLLELRRVVVDVQDGHKEACGGGKCRNAVVGNSHLEEEEGGAFSNTRKRNATNKGI